MIGKDLTLGKVNKNLLALAIPMLIANLLYSGYSIINTMWVGKLVGDDAVGAISLSLPVVLALVGLATGATMATSLLVAKHYGAKEYKMVEKVVANSYSVSIIISIILTFISIAFSKSILEVMNTPKELMEMSLSYLRITLSGVVFSYMYFLISAILRGIGNTFAVLIYLAISTAINAVLDPLLISGIGPFPCLGLNGAALASVISQGVSCILAFVYLNNKNSIVAIKPLKFAFDKQIILSIVKIGFPSMTQQVLVQIGSLFVTSFVNIFGSYAISAFGAATRVDSIMMMIAMAMSMAVSILTGQSIGAQKVEKINEVFKWGAILTTIFVLPISLIALCIPEQTLALFVQNESIIAIGSDYLRIVGATYVMLALALVTNGVVNGSGNTVATMLITFIALWGIRVPASALLCQTDLGVKGIWVAVALSFGVNMIASLAYYFSYKWKKILKLDMHSKLAADT